MSGVVGGTAGGINKITHNLGSVAATVSMDREYSDARQRDAVNAPAGVKEGMLRGGEKLMTGVFGGIAGIVTKPVQGAKQDGAAGFFKGFGKGLVGAVAKPIAGVVDLTANTFAGIHNEFDTKVEVEPVRKPRVVDDNPLEPYRERLAYAQDILWQIGSTDRNEIVPNSSGDLDLSEDVPLAYAVTHDKRYIGKAVFL